MVNNVEHGIFLNFGKRDAMIRVVEPITLTGLLIVIPILDGYSNRKRILFSYLLVLTKYLCYTPSAFKREE